MSCLLPQFKCSPDTFAVNFKLQSNYLIHTSKSREPVVFRTQCVLSATATPALAATSTLIELEKLQLSSLGHSSPNKDPDDRSWNTHSTSATAVLDMQKLKLHPLDTDAVPGAANKPGTYIEEVRSHSQATLRSMLASEKLLTSEEAVIAAAASEALAFAKAAVKVAKEAAMMANPPKSTNSSTVTSEIFPEIPNTKVKSQLAHLSQRSGFRESKTAEIELGEINPASNPLLGPDDMEPSAEELELLEVQLSESIAVRSNRQTERKTKRSKAAEKAAANIVSLKSGSSSRKKRSSVQEVDYTDPLRYFRGTATSSRLLSASEEQVLSEGIQVLLKLERIQVELKKRFGVDPTYAQWAAAAGVDQRTLKEQLNYGALCKDKMITSNIRLVISIAKHYQGAGMSLQDLVQEGCRGLVRGTEKFDATKGFKFSTYAHWWIRQAVRKSLSEQSRIIRLPLHMVEASYKVKEARKQLSSDNGKQPNNEQLAEATGLSMKRLEAVMLIPKAPKSLDQKNGFNNLKPSDVISHPDAETTEDMLIKKFMRQDLAKVLDTLNPREKLVVQWRFGLDDGRMKTLQEIGEFMGVSRERIRQIEACAFRKLKSKKRTKHLHQYVTP